MLIQYLVVGFRLNGGISILRNHSNNVSKLGNTDFPHLVGEYGNIDFVAILRKTHPFIGVEFKSTAEGFLKTA